MVRTIFSIFMVFSSSVYSSRLGDMISHLGNVTNFNEAGSYQDQSTGRFSAGSMMVRQRNRTMNPINIRLPHSGGSCGNMDLRLGGLSFMKAGEFVDMFKSMAQGMPIYAVQLALDTYVPQIAQRMTGLQNFLLKVNAMMLDECHGRQHLMEAVLPKGTAMHEQVCLEMQQSGSINNDYSGAKDRCKRKSKQDEAAKALKDQYKDLLISEYNLVWGVMKKMPRYREDAALAQTIMSLVGTVVSIKVAEGVYRTRFIAPKADDEKFLEAFLVGGETQVLVCDETTKCLGVRAGKYVITPANSLAFKILKNIRSLRVKYLTETKFSPQEMVFLSDSVNLPLYKYIQISASAHVNYPLRRAAQYIAMSILLKQFEEVAAEIIKVLSVIEPIQIDVTVIKKFKERLELARTRLQQKMSTLDSKEIWMLEKITKAKEAEMRANHDLEQGV